MSFNGDAMLAEEKGEGAWKMLCSGFEVGG